MASRGLVGDAWLERVACRWCRSRSDEGSLLLCDSCGAGCHYYCGPLATEKLPPDDGSLWLCLFCTRGDNVNLWDAESRPPPMANMELQTGIGAAVTAGYAGSTIVRDDDVFAHFTSFVTDVYGYEMTRHHDYFNADRCRRHRSEAVAGYLTTVRVSPSARVREPFCVLGALRRAFRLHSLVMDAFGPDGLAHSVARGLRMIVPPVPQSRKVGATVDMLSAVRADSLSAGVSPQERFTRMLGLAALFAYAAGARASEFCTTSVRVRGGRELNKHTLVRRMVHVVYVAGLLHAIEIFPASSKTTSYGRGVRSRPKPIVFLNGPAAEGEPGLGSLLCVGIAAWLREAGSGPEDPMFSFRHGAFRKTCTRDEFSAYTKAVAASVHLNPAHFSTKSWKVGRVSFGVVSGESEGALLARGNHLTVSANVHYRPGALLFGAAAASMGISAELARDESRRDDYMRGGEHSSSDTSSDE
jgi:hypothetical protein